MANHSPKSPRRHKAIRCPTFLGKCHRSSAEDLDELNSIRSVRRVAPLVTLPRLHPQQEDNAVKEHWVRLVASLVVAAMILGVSGVALANGKDEDECTVATLDGLYVFTASGFNIVSGVPQPKAIIELIHFFGDGTLGGTAPSGGTVSINGVINPIPPHPGPGGSYTSRVWRHRTQAV